MHPEPEISSAFAVFVGAMLGVRPRVIATTDEMRKEVRRRLVRNVKELHEAIDAAVRSRKMD